MRTRPSAPSTPRRRCMKPPTTTPKGWLPSDRRIWSSDTPNKLMARIDFASMVTRRMSTSQEVYGQAVHNWAMAAMLPVLSQDRATCMAALLSTAQDMEADAAVNILKDPKYQFSHKTENEKRKRQTEDDKLKPRQPSTEWLKRRKALNEKELVAAKAYVGLDKLGRRAFAPVAAPPSPVRMTARV